MKKTILAVVVVLAVFSSTAWSETTVFQLSVTIPATASLGSIQNNQNQLRSSMTNQLTIQTDHVIRNNQSVTVTSAVVP